MTQEQNNFNGVAPLANVAALAALIKRLQTRAYTLPGMGVFYGPAGFGKSFAATYSTIKYNAVTVQVKSAWTRKKLCEAICSEMGLQPARSIGDMVEQISEQLAMTDRPLIIDEVDHLMTRQKIELVRDIYEGSQAPIVLIGEELLPQKLKEWERVHGRILSWVGAEPASLSDVGHLAAIYAPSVNATEELKRLVLRNSKGSIRRVSVNLALVQERALVKGVDTFEASDLVNLSFYTGEAPAPRRGIA